ncbi:MAG: hypothetical protein O2897_00990 [bacterium]|nr:hypothetical protein [bacterium]
MIISASAPGKLVLAGEYAVLSGYSGLAIAINNRVTISVSKTTKPTNSFNLIPPQTDSGQKLLAAFFKTADKMGLSVKPQEFTIDSTPFFLQTNNKITKLGLGSSAAVLVCLAAQILKQNQLETSNEAIFKLAFKAHREFNNQQGSGIDIAASCYGGLIKFQKNAESTSPVVTQLKPVIDLKTLIPVFTNQSQSTEDFLTKVFAWKSKSPQAYSDIMQNLGEVGLELEKNICIKNDWKILVEIIAENIKLLTQLGEAANIGLITPNLTHLINLAKTYGGIAKPSGAGGGDMAICFIPLENQLEFRAKLSSLGLKDLRLDFWAKGVQI